MAGSADSTGGLTRRRLLGGTALAAAWAVMPGNVRRALAAPVAPRPIEHVVLLMQENRSFDHYFGTMPGVRGFADPNAMRLPNGSPVFMQPDPENPDGYTLPFHLDTCRNSVQRIPSTSHEWSAQHVALADGRMDNWLPAHRKADGPEGLHRGRTALQCARRIPAVPGGVGGFAAVPQGNSALARGVLRSRRALGDAARGELAHAAGDRLRTSGVPAGPRADGWRPNASTTPRCCASSNGSPVSRNPISRRGVAAPSAISPRRCDSISPPPRRRPSRAWTPNSRGRI